MVSNGLFVDAYFRMCSFDQIGPCQSHNSFLNGTNEYKTKNKTPLAWGICYVYSKQSLFKTQKNILDLGSPKITKALFEKIIKRIGENSGWCSYGDIRMAFTEQDKIAEKERLEFMRVAFKAGKELRIPIPVALFVWKLLDVTEIWASKKPDFLVGVKEKIESFHKSLAAGRKKVAEIRHMGIPSRK